MQILFKLSIEKNFYNYASNFPKLFLPLIIPLLEQSLNFLNAKSSEMSLRIL